MTSSNAITEQNSTNENSSDADRSSRTTSVSFGSAHQQKPATKAPKQVLEAVYASGKYKASLALDVLAVQSFMAGIYIAAASQLFLSVGGGVLGAALFPGGLIAVVLTGAELFTGDATVFVAAVLGGQVTFRSLLRNWFVSWIGNFAGALAWAYFLGYLSRAVEDKDAVALAISVAEKKAGQSLASTFLKAIGANFCVGVGIWQGTCAEEVAGKVLALWFPIFAFVAMGFDHVVANEYFFPMGMFLGADVSYKSVAGALAMATFGNIVGGGILVGSVYWYVFDTVSRENALQSRIRKNMNMQLTRMKSGLGTSFRRRREIGGSERVISRDSPDDQLSEKV